MPFDFSSAYFSFIFAFSGVLESQKSKKRISLGNKIKIAHHGDIGKKMDGSCAVVNISVCLYLDIALGSSRKINRLAAYDRAADGQIESTRSALLVGEPYLPSVIAHSGDGIISHGNLSSANRQYTTRRGHGNFYSRVFRMFISHR
jgi:hypothetical protein